jgi:UDP-3-O-[3-hydroxymyristoyl] glucosamine N-acyltransferase
MKRYTVGELASLVDGEPVGEVDHLIGGVAPLDVAGPEDLSFVASRQYLPYLATTSAGVVLAPRALAGEVPASLSQILVRDPHIALAAILRHLFPSAAPPPGIHPTAIVAESARLGEGVSIGPYAVIGEEASLGSRVRVDAHTVIGEGASVGDDSWLHPHVTVYPGVRIGHRCVVRSGARLGSDGFGYVWSEGEHRKVPQVGGCIIADDVEIGANTTVDRGSIGDSAVGQGSKLDNLVHLGHNVRVGNRVLIVAQTGIAGSSSVGDGAVLGGQAGVGGHLTIGRGARVGAQAGVTGNVADGETVSGYPARPHREALRAQAALFRLPDILRRIQKIERALFAREERP